MSDAHDGGETEPVQAGDATLAGAQSGTQSGTQSGLLPVIFANNAAASDAINLAIAAWLHAKFQRSRSAKTQSTYSAIVQAFRAQLLSRGLDLDAADPRRVAVDADAMPVDTGDLMAERTKALALAAQAFASQSATSRYGARPVTATTANLRLAALSSFYRYALRHDFLRGENPLERVERQVVQAYASARPLAYDDLRGRLAAIDLTTPAGLRDYALLLLGLHTGRRLSELAGLRREHIVIRASRVELTWVRCKGGKIMRDDLPRKGIQGLAAEALVAWVMRLYGEDGETEPLLPDATVDEMRSRGGGRPPNRRHDADAVATADMAIERVQPAGEIGLLHTGRRQPERPIWISLAARNGTFGHPLSIRAIALINEQRLGTSKVHALRHTFARGLEDAGAKVSEIQARLGHADLGTTGRYLAQLHAGENPHLARLSHLYGLEDRLKSAPRTPPSDETSS
ncbi:MAG TPA: tyrosine-type recombinase/integrase [Ktedonobacterales bacterium]|nr:tyrosine-type recombinase/integrase [Ktedonobacterales bacterium]